MESSPADRSAQSLGDYRGLAFRPRSERCPRRFRGIGQFRRENCRRRLQRQSLSPLQPSFYIASSRMARKRANVRRDQCFSGGSDVSEGGRHPSRNTVLPTKLQSTSGFRTAPRAEPSALLLVDVLQHRRHQLVPRSKLKTAREGHCLGRFNDFGSPTISPGSLRLLRRTSSLVDIAPALVLISCRKIHMQLT